MARRTSGRALSEKRLPKDWEVQAEQDPLYDAIEKELRFRHLLRAARKGGKKDQGNACREWWRAMEVLLELNAKAFRPTRGALAQLSKLAGYLAVGTIPYQIEFARTRGQRSPGPTERSHIGWAVAYRKAVRDGRIKDVCPTQTISKHYDVTPRTVQKWSSTITPPIGSDKMTGDQIKQEMERAARAYPGPSKKVMAGRKRRERE
jgi:hypothetical protein